MDTTYRPFRRVVTGHDEDGRATLVTDAAREALNDIATWLARSP